jgi:hypothetical protein
MSIYTNTGDLMVPNTNIAPGVIVNPINGGYYPPMYQQVPYYQPTYYPPYSYGPQIQLPFGIGINLGSNRGYNGWTGGFNGGHRYYGTGDNEDRGEYGHRYYGNGENENRREHEHR